MSSRLIVFSPVLEGISAPLSQCARGDSTRSIRPLPARYLGLCQKVHWSMHLSRGASPTFLDAPASTGSNGSGTAPMPHNDLINSALPVVYHCTARQSAYCGPEGAGALEASPSPCFASLLVNESCRYRPGD